MTTRPGVLDTRDRTIYEVNIRQYTEEGTFDAFRAHLGRLQDLGVGTLWLMPIHPISKQGRKGTLGSYYAVADYDAVNPEFGDDAAFRRLVDDAHARGMQLIIDWVANHTGQDHPWTVSDPHRFTRDESGKFKYPVPDWTDTWDLDYDDPSTRTAMRDAMLRWVRDFGIDGFRCDVAAMVPQDFWEETIPALRREKPIFMLAEAQEKWIHEAGFDATYAWDLGNAVIAAAEGKGPVSKVREQVRTDEGIVGSGFRMHFTTNHDWNSWEGVAMDRLGQAHDAATVLSFTLPGMPLIYSGQEAGLDRAIKFFDKDPITWRAHDHAKLFQTLTRLKRDEPALHHGPEGGSMAFLDDADAQVVAFKRTKGDSEVTVLANLSHNPAKVRAGWVDQGANPIDEHGKPALVTDALAPWAWAIFRKPR